MYCSVRHIKIEVFVFLHIFQEANDIYNSDNSFLFLMHMKTYAHFTGRWTLLEDVYI